MNKINQTTNLEDVKVNIKMKLSALWVVLMFLYVYADIFKLFMPGEIERIISGRQGPVSKTQGSLLTASVLMIFPAVMVFLSLALRPQVNRWANLIPGVLYTFVNISNLIGETWAFYVLFGIVEIVLTVLIVGYAWMWRNPVGAADSVTNELLSAS